MSERTKQPTVVRAVATKPESPTLSRGLGDLPNARAWSVPLVLPALYLSFVPIAEYTARLQFATPFLDAIMHPVLWGLSGFDANYTHGATAGNEVIAISLFYAVAVWVGSVILSVTGQSMGRPEGYQNRAPRLGKNALTGLPHRLTALHQNLMENFPLFAMVAVFTQMKDPLNAQLVELLSLHVISKTFLYIPFYAADMDFPRSLSHFMGIGACVRAFTILALN